MSGDQVHLRKAKEKQCCGLCGHFSPMYKSPLPPHRGHCFAPIPHCLPAAERLEGFRVVTVSNGVRCPVFVAK